MISRDLTAKSDGTFVAPEGGRSFLVEPLDHIAPWALSVLAEGVSGRPILVTHPRLYAPVKDFRRLEFSGAPAGSNWRVTVLQEGEAILDPGVGVGPVWHRLWVRDLTWDDLPNGTLYFGPTGELEGDFGSPILTDVRRYDQVKLQLCNTGAIAGPANISPSLDLYLGSDTVDYAGAMNPAGDFSDNGANGFVLIGDGLSESAFWSSYHLVRGLVVPFVRPRIWVNGAADPDTNGMRVALWGRRRG